MKLDEKDMPDIVSKLDSLAEKNEYTKIFAKIPSVHKDLFLDNGYVEEAFVPGFFKGEQDGSFLGKFLSPERKNNKKTKVIGDILEKSKARQADKKRKETRFTIRKAGPADINDMSRIYSEVFQSYPFPIKDPQYLLETMKTHVHYYVACDNKEPIAVSSAETDSGSKNSEMTDFATLPEYRKKGIAGNLLYFMDQDMSEKGFKTVFTIARAVSYGMNFVFAENGYSFAGTLVNNTNIAGAIESMNVWYKNLQTPKSAG